MTQAGPGPDGPRGDTRARAGNNAGGRRVGWGMHRIAVLALTLAALAAAPAGAQAPSLDAGGRSATRSCGTFHAKGVQTPVRVRIVRGHTSCRTARGVLRSLFAHKRTHVRGWRCVGPQTGYSQCVKGRARIQGVF